MSDSAPYQGNLGRAVLRGVGKGIGGSLVENRFRGTRLSFAPISSVYHTKRDFVSDVLTTRDIDPRMADDTYIEALVNRGVRVPSRLFANAALLANTGRELYYNGFADVIDRVQDISVGLPTMTQASAAVTALVVGVAVFDVGARAVLAYGEHKRRQGLREAKKAIPSS